MSSSGEMIRGQMPTPGRALKGVLWGVFGLAVFWAVVVNYVPLGHEAFDLLTFSPHMILRGQLWRLFSAGLLSPPGGPGSVNHLFFTLLGLYFLSPDLESRWGSARFLKFLLWSILSAYTLAFLVDLVPMDLPILHTSRAYGLGPVIEAVAVAWSFEHANDTVRLFFFLPLRGVYLRWLALGLCVANMLFVDPPFEGFIAPFGGVAAGFLFAGKTSPIRTMYLQWKLARLRKKTGGLSAASMLEGSPLRRPGPSLRVIKGSLDDDPPRKDPPRDKRYLN